MRKYVINEEFFDTWSRPMAYVLGFVTADGYLHPRGKLEISTKTEDECILEYILKNVSPTGPIYHSKILSSDKSKTYYRSKITLSSSRIMHCLEYKHGLSRNKTGYEMVPPTLPKELFGDYLRGVFDGDGSVSIKGDRSDFTCASYDFLYNLRSLSGNIGFILCNRSKNNCYYWVNKKKATKQLASIIYQNEEFALPRKKKRMLQWD